MICKVGTIVVPVPVFGIDQRTGNDKCYVGFRSVKDEM